MLEYVFPILGSVENSTRKKNTAYFSISVSL